MTTRFTASRLLLVAACGAGLLYAAPTASAACSGGQWQDPITGTCWSQNSPSNSFGGSGNVPCFPGRIGLCLSALQNTPIPGATLDPNLSWPGGRS